MAMVTDYFLRVTKPIVHRRRHDLSHGILSAMLMAPSWTIRDCAFRLRRQRWPFRDDSAVITGRTDGLTNER